MQIAKLNAMLTATANGFAGVFSGAGNAVKDFGKTAAGVASGLAVYDLAKGAVTGIYSATAGLVHSQMEAIDTTAKLGDTLGITTKSLSRLQYAASYAGASNEDLAAGLNKMNKNLAEAAGGSGPAADTMKALGLNAQELLNIPADERIGKIADALNAVENPAQRAALAQDVFGKGAVTLIPLLSEGSAGLKRYGEEADKLGYSFDRIDAAQIEAANDAITKVQNVLVGVATQLAVKLAPFIEALANKLSDLATSGDGMAATVVNGFEAVVKGVALSADYLDLLKAGFKYLQAGAALALAGIIKGIDLVGDGVVKLLNLLPGVELQWSETFGAMADGLVEEAGKLADEGNQAFADFSNGTNSKAVGQFFDELRKGSADAAAATADAKSKWGAFNDEIAKTGDAAKEAAKEQEKLAAEAKKYYDETRTPAEKYAAEIEHINELLVAGALDQETAQRAADKAAKEFVDAEEKDGTKGGEKNDGPKLLQAGSQEAASFVAGLQHKADDAKDAKATAKNTERAAKLLEKIASRDETSSSGGTITVVQWT